MTARRPGPLQNLVADAGLGLVIGEADDNNARRTTVLCDAEPNAWRSGPDPLEGRGLHAATVLIRAAQYDGNAIRFKNPFIPLLRFTVGTGLEIVSQHQARHLLQAERVKQSPEFPR